MRLDTCDARQHRAGDLVHLHLPPRPGVGTGGLSLLRRGVGVGLARGPWARGMAARSCAPLVLAHAIDPHVPRSRARPYVGGRTA